MPGASTPTAPPRSSGCPEHALDVLGRDAARAQQPQRVALGLDDRRIPGRPASVRHRRSAGCASRDRLRRRRPWWRSPARTSWRLARQADGRARQSARRQNPSACAARSVLKPAVTSGWIAAPSRSGSTSVSGPGQNASASFCDSGSNSATALAISSEETCAISGLKRGRPLASKMRATARPLAASPARP